MHAAEPGILEDLLERRGQDRRKKGEEENGIG
jgi:hypothetical protein